MPPAFHVNRSMPLKGRSDGDIRQSAGRKFGGCANWRRPRLTVLLVIASQSGDQRLTELRPLSLMPHRRVPHGERT